MLLVFVELPLTGWWGVPIAPASSTVWDSLVWTESAALRLQAGVESREPTVSHEAVRSLSLNALSRKQANLEEGCHCSLVDSGCVRVDPAHYRHHWLRTSIPTWGIRFLDRISTCIHSRWAGQVPGLSPPDTSPSPRQERSHPPPALPEPWVCLRSPLICWPGMSEPGLELCLWDAVIDTRDSWGSKSAASA